MSRGIVETGSNQLEVLDFRLKTKNGKEEIYGINVSKVTEIVAEIGRIAIVPGSPPSQLGIVSIRDKTIPVFDMGKFLDIAHTIPADPTKDPLVVTEFSHLSLGFLVHSVNRIRRLSWKDIQPVSTTNAGAEGNRRVVGTVILPKAEGEGIMLILDLEAIASTLGFFQHQEKDSEEFSGETRLDGKKIIVVEDSMPTRKIEISVLKKAGATLFEFGNGQEALLFLQKNPEAIDLVVSDVEMPLMDGYALSKKIGEMGLGIPVILHSSMSGRANIKKGKEAGATRYIVKLDPKDLVAQCHEVIEEAKKS